MPLSHKTLFSRAVKTQKVRLSFKQSITVPFPLFPYIVVFFSCFSLSNIFFQNFSSMLLISGKYIWTLCQTALKTLLKWQWPVRNMTLLHSLLLSEDVVSPTESKCKCFFPLIPICKFTLSPFCCRGFHGRRESFGRAGLTDPSQKIKVIQTMYEALFWGQSHVSNSFSFGGINPSLNKGERITVKLTNINLIVADLCVKRHLYNRAG